MPCTSRASVAPIRESSRERERERGDGSGGFGDETDCEGSSALRFPPQGFHEPRPHPLRQATLNPLPVALFLVKLLVLIRFLCSYSSVAIQLCDESVEGMTIEYVDIAPLPFVNTDLEVDGTFPEPVEAFRQTIRGADAILFASPEYNYSFTGNPPSKIQTCLKSYWLSFDRLHSCCSVLC